MWVNSIYLPTSWWAFEFFQVLLIVNNVATNIACRSFTVTVLMKLKDACSLGKKAMAIRDSV